MTCVKKQNKILLLVVKMRHERENNCHSTKRYQTSPEGGGVKTRRRLGGSPER